MIETECTILGHTIAYETNEKQEYVLPLPSSILLIHDNKDNYAQLVIRPHKKDFEAYAKVFHKDVGLIWLMVCNDPHAKPGKPVINLGYHSVRYGLTRGECKIVNDEIHFTTLDASETMWEVNVPIKGVNSMQDRAGWNYENKGWPSRYLYVDTIFGASTLDDFEYRLYIYDYTKNQGAVLHATSNLQSILNGFTEKQFQLVKNVDTGLRLVQSFI